MAMARAVEEITASQSVQFIVFPELATTGYECGVRFFELADELTGYITEALTGLAEMHGAYIVFGMALRHKTGGVIYNAAVMVRPDGDDPDFYAKVHLRGEERLTFREGYRFNLYDTEYGPVGLMVGWDLAFPETARIYTLQGANLICLPACWEEAAMQDWRTLLPARALENGLYIAAANRIGEEPSYRFGGRSAIIGPDGRYLALMQEDEAGLPTEGFAIARLNLSSVRRMREDRGIIQSRQPSTYRQVVKRY
jgi:predicted amidohydrolase